MADPKIQAAQAKALRKGLTAGPANYLANTQNPSQDTSSIWGPFTSDIARAESRSGARPLFTPTPGTHNYQENSGGRYGASMIAGENSWIKPDATNITAAAADGLYYPAQRGMRPAVVPTQGTANYNENTVPSPLNGDNTQVGTAAVGAGVPNSRMPLSAPDSRAQLRKMWDDAYPPTRKRR